MPFYSYKRIACATLFLLTLRPFWASNSTSVLSSGKIINPTGKSIEQYLRAEKQKNKGSKQRDYYDHKKVINFDERFVRTHFSTIMPHTSTLLQPVWKTVSQRDNCRNYYELHTFCFQEFWFNHFFTAFAGIVSLMLHKTISVIFQREECFIILIKSEACYLKIKLKRCLTFSTRFQTYSLMTPPKIFPLLISCCLNTDNVLKRI